MNLFLLPADSQRVADALLEQIKAGMVPAAVAPALPDVPAVVVEVPPAPVVEVAPPEPVAPAPVPTAWDNVKNFERPLISREQAVAQGLPRYFDGRSCRHGHITERQLRGGNAELVGNCTECMRAAYHRGKDRKVLGALAERASAREREALKRALPALTVVPVNRERRRGILIPLPGSEAGKVWAECDRLSHELGQPVPIRVLLESTRKLGLNEGNVKAECREWRKSWGVTGRVTLPTLPLAAAPPAPPAFDNVAGIERPIVTKAEARAKGLTRFFTGVACVHGHVTERYTSSGQCTECMRKSRP